MVSTVAIDFDGTLAQRELGWRGSQNAGPPVPGALEFVEELVRSHTQVIVFTCRAHSQEGYIGVITWLRDHGFPPMQVTSLKPSADLYIDDKAVRFTGDWDEVRSVITTGSGTTHGGDQAGQAPPAY